jgi:hypothetical protein
MYPPSMQSSLTIGLRLIKLVLSYLILVRPVSVFQAVKDYLHHVSTRPSFTALMECLSGTFLRMSSTTSVIVTFRIFRI